MPQAPAPPERSFVAKLFDPQFDEFITPVVVKVVYIVMMVGVALVCVLGFVSHVNSDPGIGWGLLGLALFMLGGFLYIMFVRLVLESFMVLFKIEQNTRRQ